MCGLSGVGLRVCGHGGCNEGAGVKRTLVVVVGGSLEGVREEEDEVGRERVAVVVAAGQEDKGDRMMR